MKTPITWYGGKQRMLKYILPLIPEHVTYTESFFGGGALYFAKEPARCEVINDTNKEAINFYSVIVKDFDKLHAAISSTLHSRSTFDDAKLMNSNPHLFSEVQRAWAFYTLSNQSFASNFSSFGFNIACDRTVKAVEQKKKSFIEDYKTRLQHTTIENDDALKIIARYDSVNTFHYVDPPYFNSDCGHYDGYTEQDFKNLLNTLSLVEGKFLLSSYPSSLLTEYSEKNGWFTKQIKKKVSVNNGENKMKTEVLTANYPIG